MFLNFPLYYCLLLLSTQGNTFIQCCVTLGALNPLFYPPPDEAGAGGIGVASDVRVRFQVGISLPENFQLGKIQNDRLLAIINFNMPDIW